MKQKKALLIFLFTVMSFTTFAQKLASFEHAIIPKPLKAQFSGGFFTLNESTQVVFKENTKETPLLLTTLNTLPGKFATLKPGKKQKNNVITFSIDPNLHHNEAYVLDIQKKSITITYKTGSGAFYAIKTLQQLVKDNADQIPCGKIEDSPRFAYRSMMIDVCRHFYSIDFIKKYIDVLSFYKFNTLHLHLTDDQAWRIEIKKYPKLQEISAFRDETLIGHLKDMPQVFDGKRYGGYYTQEQLKDLVKYAQSKFITIIPEIELPGHATAAIAAYPHLGVNNDSTVKVATKWGIFYDIYSPREETFKFLEDVLTEVIAIFPGKYIHIGGDEAPKDQWKASTEVQQIIKKNNLKDEHELQSYFVQRIEKFLATKGKSIIGWDEILEGGLAPNATVMSWRGEEGGIAAAKLKHNVIMTPHPYLYFDGYQTKGGRKTEPLAIGSYLPVEKVYSYDPIPASLSADERKYVLGVQANLWTEYIKTPDHFDHMAFPRALALAEIAWTPVENKNFDNFTTRAIAHMKHLKDHRIKFSEYFFKGVK